jgi:hypothetical protein
VVHLGNLHIPQPVRVFKEFAAEVAPTLFPPASDLIKFCHQCWNEKNEYRAMHDQL